VEVEGKVEGESPSEKITFKQSLKSQRVTMKLLRRVAITGVKKPTHKPSR
jgi:hypothetical protein